ncbi:F0F1 ATP synthase subunit B [Phosphitispora fastidiosa]|uniref:F0F1 ATP synthase subunit B n=1 Tax=Phosphitispora fastidiosa TaxID=2837202 RepID=UPI001E62F24B|nr:F0F1 ATP synthase subunit B [Phosphitispora fastidiosa]MBU7007363.1 F-type H+-transporting ATPase subunit b [Phosphitispora fastidiosa]
MGAILESLGFEFPKFLWQVVNFLILLFLLKKFAYKPILDMLDERKKSIEDAINNAETAKNEAEKMRKEYETRLAEAKQDAQEIMAKATKLGEEMKREIVDNAQSEATKAIQKAQEEINREKDQAIAALRDEVAVLAVMAAGQVLGKAISVEDHEKLVKEFVSEVGDLKC